MKFPTRPQSSTGILVRPRDVALLIVVMPGRGHKHRVAAQRLERHAEFEPVVVAAVAGWIVSIAVIDPLAGSGALDLLAPVATLVVLVGEVVGPGKKPATIRLADSHPRR